MKAPLRFSLSFIALLGLLFQSSFPAFAVVDEYLNPETELDIGSRQQYYVDVEVPKVVPQIGNYSAAEDYYDAMDEYHTNLGINFLSYNWVSAFPGRNAYEGAAETVIGYESNINGFREFKPNANVNRAEVAKLMTLSLDLFVPYGIPYDFPDIDSEWYAFYFNILSEVEVINGVPGDDGLLYADPEGTVNWAQLAKFTVNSFQLHDGFPVNEAAAPVWYEPYLNILEQKNIIHSADVIDPSDAVTRGEVMMVIFRSIMVQGATMAYEQEFVFDDELIPMMIEYIGGPVLNQAAYELTGTYNIDSINYMFDLLRTSGDSIQLYAIQDYTPEGGAGSPEDEVIYLYYDAESGSSVNVQGYSVSILTTSTGLNFDQRGFYYTFEESLMVEPGGEVALSGDSFYEEDPTYVALVAGVLDVPDELFVEDEYVAILLYSPDHRLVDVAVMTIVGE